MLTFVDPKKAFDAVKLPVETKSIEQVWVDSIATLGWLNIYTTSQHHLLNSKNIDGEFSHWGLTDDILMTGESLKEAQEVMEALKIIWQHVL